MGSISLPMDSSLNLQVAIIVIAELRAIADTAAKRLGCFSSKVPVGFSAILRTTAITEGSTD
jgi:hypothetical protein